MPSFTQSAVITVAEHLCIAEDKSGLKSVINWKIMDFFGWGFGDATRFIESEIINGLIPLILLCSTYSQRAWMPKLWAVSTPYSLSYC